MKKGKPVLWNNTMLSELGTISDVEFSSRYNVGVFTAGRKRKALGIQRHGTKPQPRTIHNCRMCGKAFYKGSKERNKNKNFYCSQKCFHIGLKKGDSDKIQYGSGWFKAKNEVLKRDIVCQACGSDPGITGKVLHVHHIKPFKFGGTNTLDNLVGLCNICHRKIEIQTQDLLSAIDIKVKILNGRVEVFAQGKKIEKL